MIGKARWEIASNPIGEQGGLENVGKDEKRVWLDGKRQENVSELADNQPEEHVKRQTSVSFSCWQESLRQPDYGQNFWPHRGPHRQGQ